MARKKKHPEHENLERWLVSYADFMTLLFATFVVLYALSQVDVSALLETETSLKKAFAKPAILEGSDGMLDKDGKNIIEGSPDTSLVALMEYISQKYEAQEFNNIEKAIEEAVKNGELSNNIDVSIDERGLVIKISQIDTVFAPASATVIPSALKDLDLVGALIRKSFKAHLIRIEGHTDNMPLYSPVYPSNWELSAARASTVVRYFISKFKFSPKLFSAVGYADIRPIDDNSSEKGRAKNRRVEIIVLKNKLKTFEGYNEKMFEVNSTKGLDIINNIQNYTPYTSSDAMNTKGTIQKMEMEASEANKLEKTDSTLKIVDFSEDLEKEFNEP